MGRQLELTLLFLKCPKFCRQLTTNTLQCRFCAILTSVKHLDLPRIELHATEDIQRMTGHSRFSLVWLVGVMYSNPHSWRTRKNSPTGRQKRVAMGIVTNANGAGFVYARTTCPSLKAGTAEVSGKKTPPDNGRRTCGGKNIDSWRRSTPPPSSENT